MATLSTFQKKVDKRCQDSEIPLYMLKEKRDNMGVKKTRIVMDNFSSFITFYL